MHHSLALGAAADSHSLGCEVEAAFLVAQMAHGSVGLRGCVGLEVVAGASIRWWVA